MFVKEFLDTLKRVDEKTVEVNGKKHFISSYSKLLAKDRYDVYLPEYLKESTIIRTEKTKDFLLNLPIISTFTRASDLGGIYTPEILNNLTIARDIKNPKLCLLWDENLNRISSLNYESVIASIKTRRKECDEWISNKSTASKLVYDPFTSRTYWKEKIDNIIDVLFINTFEHLPWSKLKPRTNKCPTVIRKLLDHLFPEAKQREEVEKFCYLMIKGRARTFLILNGARGIGKNKFVEVLKPIMGERNTTVLKSNFFSDGNNFNDAIRNKRLAYLDEMPITQETSKNLKKYGNDIQAIEAKFETVTEEKIFCSFIILNNYDTQVYIDQKERRFSVPDLTVQNLNTVLTSEELEYIERPYQQDHQTQCDFAFYLFEKFKGVELDTMNFEKPIRDSKRYWQLSYDSLPPFKKFCIKYMMEAESDKFEYSNLQALYDTDDKAIKDTQPKPHNFYTFLMEFKPFNKPIFKIGNYCNSKNRIYIVPDKSFSWVVDNSSSIDIQLVNLDEEELDI